MCKGVRERDGESEGVMEREGRQRGERGDGRERADMVVNICQTFVT